MGFCRSLRPPPSDSSRSAAFKPHNPKTRYGLVHRAVASPGGTEHFRLPPASVARRPMQPLSITRIPILIPLPINTLQPIPRSFLVPPVTFISGTPTMSITQPLMTDRARPAVCPSRKLALNFKNSKANRPQPLNKTKDKLPLAFQEQSQFWRRTRAFAYDLSLGCVRVCRFSLKRRAGVFR